MVSFYRVIKFAVQNFWRNKWQSIACIVIMFLALTIFAFTQVIRLASDNIRTSIKDKIDVEVFFKPEIAEKEVLGVKDQLTSNDQIKSIEYIDKDKAMEIWRERYKDNQKLIESANLNKNPLPASLKIMMKNPEKIKSLANNIQENYKTLIRSISYQGNSAAVTDKILSFINNLGWGAIAMTIFFAIISLIIILNTIRMAIFSRKDEIEIMKLVGATNWFIRWPFIVEGIIDGMMATILAAAILYGAMIFANPYISKFLANFSSDSIANFNPNLPQIMLAQLAISMLLGVFSSIVAVSRHLKI